MSIETTYPGYETLDALLTQQQVTLTAAEMHGLISGILCGGNTDDSWQTLLHELTNDGLAFSHLVSQPLQTLYQVTKEALEASEFEFQLLLPDDNNTAVSVFDRADALAGWVNHFLLGAWAGRRSAASEQGAGRTERSHRRFAQYCPARL